MKAWLTLAAWVMATGAVASERPQTVAEVLAPRCVERVAHINAYLEASREGAWLVDAMGSKKGIRLDFNPQSRQRSIATVKNHVWRPQEYLNKTFRATFHGKLRCPAGSGKVVALEVGSVEKIQLSPIVGSQR
ncbi:hypothetical protein J5226_20130 [Lysobacter sp. K5869]|uniref:hypothetical protein n=1 Tax=Lysobacter sp. K5869 TaxID=2820808 RepID=UPI001C0620DB|nr:hypothetical protein [Lysobacter sp. K5869]QWP75891.1 hypothetical protein J5226_20130 [Lysobacter sp. K5869]